MVAWPKCLITHGIISGDILGRVRRPLLLRQGVDRRSVSATLDVVAVLLRRRHSSRIRPRRSSRLHPGQRRGRHLHRLLRAVLK